MSSALDDSQLGKKTVYVNEYDASLLHPIPRTLKRHEIGINNLLPFTGYDFWNHYELSWLNPKGKPVVAQAEISLACETPYLIESKSLKLYCNSLNDTRFKDVETVIAILTHDLEECVQGSVNVRVITLDQATAPVIISHFEGTRLDDFDVACDRYTVSPDFLTISDEETAELFASDLLKSNCLVTGQPDWGSLQIRYKGKKIDPAGLLRYIVSYRNHNEFGEHCIERIFMDILTRCTPTELMVHGRYTRRGGLDINVVRSTHPELVPTSNVRLCRQ